MTEVFDIPSHLDELAKKVVNAAFHVHRNLGPGLLESVYERCLCYELDQANVRYERQLALPIIYGELKIDGGLILDLLVGGELIVELKAVEKLLDVHKAQLLTYLKLNRSRLGLLINFNVSLIKDGIKRIAL
jgi:hypothetical protein